MAYACHFGMGIAKIASTPMEVGYKLLNYKNDCTTEKLKPYRELVGALGYLTSATRPDIAYSVSCLS